jgi:peptidoglycan/xylan/chitin deacetylase (PgdA/CDA1 family)
MKLPKQFYFGAVSRLNLDWLQKKSPIPYIIPYHHLVSDEKVPHIQSLYAFKNSRQFEEDLDFLLTNFEPLTLTELISRVKEKKHVKKKGFLITFDDGLRQMYEVAVPILLKKGVPAAMFINPAFIDNQEIFYDLKKGLMLDKISRSGIQLPSLRQFEEIFGGKINSSAHLEEKIRSINYLNRGITDSLGKLLEIDFQVFANRERPFITTAEVWDLIKKGFHIGSHSLDHPLYSLLPEKEQIRQTVESADWVARKFNLSYKAFAFPHSDRGVKNSFFEKLLDNNEAKLDLILGNSRGMLENHPDVCHRFIGENPDLSAEKMAKAILAYGVINKINHSLFVKRD